ncbi:hypothetical protein [Mycolicibacterium iranicum]|uniref:Uncharacterized protein n=1 Tax=Mycolicibacterium iranicum TaxID=912594 RepID=A0A178LDU9_MYCIR|nr:hypothetical protein [Mycolicibacterium iranicum]OAN28599.1 hypothetical protein A4X20_10400 [Mycolicibacterium iranicum]
MVRQVGVVGVRPYQALRRGGDERSGVIVYTAESGSSWNTVLRLLANWQEARSHPSPAEPSTGEPTDARSGI